MASADSNAYPPLPLLKAPPSQPAAPAAGPLPGSTASTDSATGSAGPTDGSAADSDTGAARTGAPTATAPATVAAAGALKSVTPAGPATLNRVRLSSADPPLSVIFDLTGPVAYDNQLQGGSRSSTLTIHLKETKPAGGLATHMVFDRSIFHDCDIQTDASGTTITVNTTPVSRFAVVPLNAPPRLLVTFTPEQAQPTGATEPSGADSGSSID